MKSPWEYLVEKRGLEGAKEEMRRRRALVKRPGRKPRTQNKPLNNSRGEVL